MAWPGNHDGAELKQLQEIWTLMYRSDLVIAERFEQARTQPLLPAAEHLCRFLEASIGQGRRGPMPAAGPLMVRLLISTGEVSGDLQGSLLIRALQLEAERRGAGAGAAGPRRPAHGGGGCRIDR